MLRYLQVALLFFVVFHNEVVSGAQCGKNVTEWTGLLETPNYPRSYSVYGKIICEWRITLDRQYTLILSSTNILPNGLVEVRDGSTQSAPLLGRFYRTSFKLTSSSNELYVKFEASDNYARFGVAFTTVEVSRDCGGNYTDLTGILTSPNYPKYDGFPIRCEWRITVDKRYIISIKSTDFHLHRHPYDRRCARGYVKVRDGSTQSGRLLGSCCERETLQLKTTTNMIIVQFETTLHARFRIIWSSAEVASYGRCGGNFTAQAGLLAAPKTPYNFHGSCEWRVTVNRRNTIFLRSRDVNPTSTGTVEVRNGSSQFGKLLGRYNSGETFDLKSSSNEIYVKLESSNTAQFSAEWTTAEVERECGGNHTELAGVLTSPSYPQYCSGSIQCEWRITVPSQYSLSLAATEFHIHIHPYDLRCDSGKVEVRDGDTQSSLLLGDYCERETLKLRTSRNMLYVTFETTLQARFRISWSSSIKKAEESCGGNIYNKNTGAIISPRYPYMNYYADAVCVWTVTVSRGHIIVVNFTYLKIEEGTGCKYDRVEIRDGPKETSPLLGNYCGHNIPKPLTTSTNTLYVKFESDSTHNRQGFNATWAVGPNDQEDFIESSQKPSTSKRPSQDASESCGGDYYTDTGIIMSPKYPYMYKKKDMCVWTVTVNTREIITIQFTYIDIESDTGCLYNKVEVRDGPTKTAPLLGQFCGRNIPTPLKTSNNALYVKFESNHIITKTGFKAIWNVEPKEVQDFAGSETSGILWPIIGGVIGGILLLVIISICVYVVRKKINSQLNGSSNDSPDVDVSNDHSDTVPRQLNQVNNDDTSVWSNSSDTLPRQSDHVNSNIAMFISSLGSYIQSSSNVGPHVDCGRRENQRNRFLNTPTLHTVLPPRLPSTSNGTTSNIIIASIAQHPTRQQMVFNGRRDRTMGRDNSTNVYILPGAIPIPPPYTEGPPSYLSVRRPPSYTSRRQSSNRPTNGYRNTQSSSLGVPPPSYASMWETEFSGDMQISNGVISPSRNGVFSPPPAYSRYTY